MLDIQFYPLFLVGSHFVSPEGHSYQHRYPPHSWQHGALPSSFLLLLHGLCCVETPGFSLAAPCGWTFGPLLALPRTQCHTVALHL